MPIDASPGPAGAHEDEPRLRPAVRGLVVDADERILLVQLDLRGHSWWICPGGGVDPGESLREALRRELVEEVGLDLDLLARAGQPPPPHVWHRLVVAPDHPPGWDGQVDDYFLVRTTAFDPRGALDDDQLAAEGIAAIRWWTPAELAAADAATVVLSPRELPRLLAALLRDGPPPSPLPLGW